MTDNVNAGDEGYAGNEVYAAVDRYFDNLFGTDPVLDAALERSASEGLPPISITSNHGRFLHVLALACGARSILEIGTLGGYSAIWLARALPDDGKLVTLEFEPHYADVARQNLAHAGLAERVEIRVGHALDSLAQLVHEDAGPFDMAFIDADKTPYGEYLQAVLRLSRPGTLIVADNVVRGGKVALGSPDDDVVAGIQRFNAALAANSSLSAAVAQLVGVKGHDGMALAVVRE